MSLFNRLVQDVTHPFGLGNNSRQPQPARTPAPMQQRPAMPNQLAVARTPAPASLAVRQPVTPRINFAPQTPSFNTPLNVRTATPQLLTANKAVIAPSSQSRTNVAGPQPKDNRALQLAAAPGLTAMRVATGYGQVGSGLVDLASRGKGTSGVSKLLNASAENLDDTSKRLGITGQYKAGNIAGEIGSYFVGAGEAKLLAKAGMSVPKIAKVAGAAGKVGTVLTKPIIRAADRVGTKNIATRAISGTMKNAVNPRLQATGAAFEALQVGKDSSKGNDIGVFKAPARIDGKDIPGVKSVPGLNKVPFYMPQGIASDLALNAIGLGGGKTAALAAKQAPKVIKDIAANKPYRQITDNQLAAVRRVSQERAGFGESIANVKPGDHETYNIVQKQLGATSANNHEVIDKLIGSRMTYQTRLADKAAKFQSAKASVKEMFNTPLNQGGYVRNPLGISDDSVGKYKNADDFIKNESTTAYHGSNQKIRNFSNKYGAQGMIWFSDSADQIKRGDAGAAATNNIMERQLTGKKWAGWDEYDRYGLHELESMGYDGIKLPDGKETNYSLFNSKGITTKQGLAKHFNDRQPVIQPQLPTAPPRPSRGVLGTAADKAKAMLDGGDPLASLKAEATKYGSADEYLSTFEKRYHQTSPDVAEAINKEGFRLDKRASGDNDILPIGVNTKRTDKSIRLPKNGAQVETYFNKDANVQSFNTRDQLERYFYDHPQASKYKTAVDNSKQIDIDYQKQVDDIGEAMNNRYKVIWEKGIKVKDDPTYQALRAKEDKAIKEWGVKHNEQSKIAQAESTRIAKQEGWDAIDIQQDTGGFGSITDNTIILDASKLKTKQQLTDLYNQANPTPKQSIADKAKSFLQANKLNQGGYVRIPGRDKGLDSVRAEASKYNSVDEFVKAIQDGKVKTLGDSPETVMAFQKEYGIDFDKAYKSDNPKALEEMQMSAVTRLFNEARQGKQSKPQAAPPVPEVLQKKIGSLADNSTVSRGTVSDTAASSKAVLPGEAAPATAGKQLPGVSLGNDIAKLPEYGTKKVSGRDKAFRSTRSVIERQGENGKSLANDLQGARDAEELMQASIQKQIPTVRSLKDKEFENFVDATQGLTEPANPKVAQAVQEWQATHPQIRERAVNPNGANLDVGDLGPSYYPHFIDYDRVFKDKNMYNASINHLVETGQATDAADAIAKLNHAKDVLRNRAFGNLEASREIDLPFYDKTPNSLVSYIGSSSKRIAQAETFGAKDEKALAKIAAAGQEGYDTEAMKNAYNVASGAKIYDSTAQKVSNGLRSYQSTTRLGLGALTNVSQNVNTGIVTGHMRTLGAAFKQFDPKTRAFVEDTGVVADAVLNDLKQQSGFIGKTLGHITAPGFGKVEKLNRSIAATAGRDYALRLAQKGDEKTLRRLGVTGDIQGKTLTEAQQVQAARKVVEKTQFKVDPQDLPGWADSPGGKLVTQFRTFSYAQGKFVSNEILKPAAKGNFMPLGRLLAALPVGYGLYETKRVINGRPEEESKTKRSLATFQNVGGAGLAFDIYQGLNPPNSKYTPSDRRVTMALGTLGGPTLGMAGQVAGAAGDLIQRKNIPADEAKLGGKVVLGKNDKTYTDATQAARLGLSQIPIVGNPIKNRVLPYKKQSDAENGFADSPKSKGGPFEALSEVLGKLTGQKGSSAASKTLSATEAIAKVKADNKDAQSKYKATLSKSDYELSKLNKSDRQKLVDQGVVSADKLKGLDKYTTTKKKELGLGTTKTPANTADGLDTHSKKVLDQYKNLDAKGRDTKAYKEYDYDYKVAKAKYENDKASGKLVSKADNIKATDHVIKLKAGSGFSKDTRDNYSLTSDELFRLASTDTDGNRIVKDALAYGDKLVAEGVETKNKFRDKRGNVTINSRAAKSAASGSKSASTKFAAAQTRALNASKLKLPKAPKFSSYKFRTPKLASSKGSGKVKLTTYKTAKAITVKKPKLLRGVA